MPENKDNDRVECKGRNGWFKLYEFDVFIGKESAWVDIYSKKRGDSPPVSFRMDGKNARWCLGKMFMQVGKFLLNGSKGDCKLNIKWEE